MNLNDARLFVRVVEHGGFAPASRHLGVSKSTLSKRVAELEHSLGARLIHRTSRAFKLTEAGAEFHRHAVAMLIEAEAAEQVVRGRLEEPSGTVRITCSVPTAQFALAPILPKLAYEWPRIDLVLHVTDRFVDIVREGFDIGLRDHFTPLPDSGLVQRRVRRWPVWLVASPSYLEQRGRPTEPVELAAHSGLMASVNQRHWCLTNSRNETVEVTPKPRFVADESAVLIHAAVAGLGIACLPGKFCADRIEGGDLQHILPDWGADGVTTTLLMPHRQGQLPAVRAVADFITRHLSEQGDAGA